MKPVVMTFWDHFIANEAADVASVIDQKPILVAMRVKLMAYSGSASSLITITSIFFCCWPLKFTNKV